jgi:hypothetical protein
MFKALSTVFVFQVKENVTAASVLVKTVKVSDRQNIIKLSFVVETRANNEMNGLFSWHSFYFSLCYIIELVGSAVVSVTNQFILVELHRKKIRIIIHHCP